MVCTGSVRRVTESTVCVAESWSEMLRDMDKNHDGVIQREGDDEAGAPHDDGTSEWISYQLDTLSPAPASKAIEVLEKAIRKYKAAAQAKVNVECPPSASDHSQSVDIMIAVSQCSSSVS
jgi:hypothetical protein